MPRNLRVLSLIFIIVAGTVGFFGGSGFQRVKITSLQDRQEVHSVVVVDASTWNADEVEILVNGEKVANYLPFYWNNMLMPAGEYKITVRIRSGLEWSEDSKLIIIPEEFIVPKDYVFTEDFVVHVGQTVIFQDGTWDLATSQYLNGPTPVDEKTYFALNNFGILILKNTNITCSYFTGEMDSITDLTNSLIFPFDAYSFVSAGEMRYIVTGMGRLDDNSSIIFREYEGVVIDEQPSFTTITYGFFDYLACMMLLVENSIFYDGH